MTRTTGDRPRGRHSLCFVHVLSWVEASPAPKPLSCGHGARVGTRLPEQTCGRTGPSVRSWLTQPRRASFGVLGTVFSSHPAPQVTLSCGGYRAGPDTLLRRPLLRAHLKANPPAQDTCPAPRALHLEMVGNFQGGDFQSLSWSLMTPRKLLTRGRKRSEGVQRLWSWALWCPFTVSILLNIENSHRGAGDSSPERGKATGSGFPGSVKPAASPLVTLPVVSREGAGCCGLKAPALEAWLALGWVLVHHTPTLCNRWPADFHARPRIPAQLRRR